MQKAKTKIVPPYKHKPSATPKRKKEYLTSTRRILTFALIAAVYWFIQNPPGVTMINPARPPDPILEPAEVEKILTLQETKDVYLLGPVSSDDASIIAIAGLDENSS
jgi:hypothetical protein